MPIDLAAAWDSLPIVVLDTETTGIGEEHAVCEVAAVRFEQGRRVAEFSSLVHPGRPIPEDATAVHGITDAMVADAPPLWAVASEIYRVACDALPCAYNAPFDRGMLHPTLHGTDCPAFDPSISWIDVFVIVASPKVDKFVKGKGRLKLGAACERHGVDLESAHRALGDARATGALLWRLFEKGLVRSVPARRLLEAVDAARIEHEEDFQRWLTRQRAKERCNEGVTQ